MEQKYQDKLKLAWDMLDYKDELSVEENEKCFDIAYDTLNELVATKNSEILVSLLEFFCEEHEDYGGICEHLKTQIGANFSLEQLLHALYEKFDYLVKHDIEISYEMSSCILYSNMFDAFRTMFNSVRSNRSDEFLEKLDNWCGDDFPEEIAILKQDMEGWNK